MLIGAGATVLGNITVGKGAQVAAGSLVLRDVPPRAMVAGSPANVIGQVSGEGHCACAVLKSKLPPLPQGPFPSSPLGLICECAGVLHTHPRRKAGQHSTLT